MITLFTCPKPFREHVNLIQRNAIRSWTHLYPKPEIILIGNEEGYAEVAKEFNLRHVPEVERNDFGTPLLNSIFSMAEREAANNIICYINADILLLDDFTAAIQAALQFQPNCLMVGQRWNLDVRKPISFRTNWERYIRDMVKKRGKIDMPNAMDFFVFSKGIYNNIPPFALGRTMFDNWLVSHARLKKVPVIDLTEMVTVVHQNHDYLHHRGGRLGVAKGEEAKANRELAGGFLFAFTAWDSDYKLTPGGVRRRSIFYRCYGDLVYISQRYSFLKPIARMTRYAREGIRFLSYVFINMF
jgi:hypothetical protein